MDGRVAVKQGFWTLLAGAFWLYQQSELRRHRPAAVALASLLVLGILATLVSAWWHPMTARASHVSSGTGLSKDWLSHFQPETRMKTGRSLQEPLSALAIDGGKIAKPPSLGEGPVGREDPFAPLVQDPSAVDLNSMGAAKDVLDGIRYSGMVSSTRGGAVGIFKQSESGNAIIRRAGESFSLQGGSVTVVRLASDAAWLKVNGQLRMKPLMDEVPEAETPAEANPAGGEPAAGATQPSAKASASGSPSKIAAKTSPMLKLSELDD